MARGRLISRSLGSSRRFHALLAAGGKIGEFCQVLYPLLVANTDDFGRMAGDAFTVKNVVLPSSKRPERDFDQALDIMHDVGLIVRYEVDAVVYLQVERFDEHQPNLHKRTKSRIPDIPESPGIPRRVRPNLTEFKGTESKRTEENLEQSSALRARSAESSTDGNLKVITVIAHEVLDVEHNDDLGELADRVKRLCASRKINYSAPNVVHRAIDCALKNPKRRAG